MVNQYQPAAARVLYTSYGAAAGTDKKLLGRQRLNWLALVMAVAAPWAIFVVTMWALSFQLHYFHWALADVIVVLAFLAVMVFAYLARKQQHQQAAGGKAEPKWYLFILATGLLVWCLGVVAGYLNFTYFVQPYYDLQGMKTYPQANPGYVGGEALQDAGRVLFDEGSILDVHKSMAFRNGRTYCVAPITHGDQEPLASYDFWAVGTDCCSVQGADSYRCGDYNHPHARGGLRLMRDDLKPWFRLAVKQAESKYRIKAKTPIFFYWMQDPIEETESYHAAGVRWFICGVFSILSLQMFNAAVFTLVCSKYGY